MAGVIGPSDETRKLVGGGQESWLFEVATGDVRLTAELLLVLPSTARLVAILSRTGLPHLVVRDSELPVPRPPGLEIRAEALWLDLVCEEPLDHWSVGLEAFGILVDDPGEDRGERTGLGLDLGWERDGDPVELHDGYRVPAVVHGEVLTGTGSSPEVLTVAGAPGRWTHRWRAAGEGQPPPIGEA